MRNSQFWKPVCLSLALLFLNVACMHRDAESDTGSAPLYVFDGNSHSVLAWDDVSAIYDAGAAGTANRTISSTELTAFELGGGGMALDSYNQYLYLVSSSGTVVRINQIRSQSGTVSSSDIISFDLKDTGTDAPDGVFGQAAVDPVGSYLYVTESTADGESQIWAIPSSQMPSTSEFTKDSNVIIGSNGIADDTHCTGVAASANAVYEYSNNGEAINPSGIQDYTGSRLRKGTSLGVFQAHSDAIVGKDDNSITLLGQYGCLAYDTRNDYLYVARVASASPLLAFGSGDFNPGMEVAPAMTYDGPSTLRVIAHAGQKDWLVGAGSGTADTLWIWKGPSAGVVSPLSVPLSGVQIQGLALDGGD